jgi:hypothetical protein
MRRDPFERRPLPLWWKAWAALCCTMAITLFVVVVWAIVKLVSRYG